MGSSGLTLGRAQGAIFVGKPLDLRVQLQADASEELQSSCVSAEVFYGETLLDRSRVSVSIEDVQEAPGRGATARVTATALIDEPIVTVNFRVGCQQKSSKRYTLFPDVATNVVESAPRAQAPKSVVADLVLPVAAATEMGSASPSNAKPKKSRSTPEVTVVPKEPKEPKVPEAVSERKSYPVAKATIPVKPVPNAHTAAPSPTTSNHPFPASHTLICHIPCRNKAGQ